MAGAKMLKHIEMIIFAQKHVRPDWQFDFDSDLFAGFFEGLCRDMRQAGVELKRRDSSDMVIHVNSYADLLNCVRLSSDEPGGVHCIGHVIGKSEHLNIMEDLAAAVRRLAFAPETVAPASEFRKVCHNCGCGC